MPTETAHEHEGSYRRQPMRARPMAALLACELGQARIAPSERARPQEPRDSVRCWRMGLDTTLRSRA